MVKIMVPQATNDQNCGASGCSCSTPFWFPRPDSSPDSEELYDTKHNLSGSKAVAVALRSVAYGAQEVAEAKV
jgi:hypothetical protein